MIKLSKEGIQKAETAQKVGLTHQTVSQDVRAKRKLFKKIKKCIQ